MQGRQLALATDQVVRPHRLAPTYLNLNQAIGGDPFRLSLQLERLDLLNADVLLNQLVRKRAEKDLVCTRSLLEASRDVDRISDHEVLARRRVGDDDFAAVHSDTGGDGDAVARVEVTVEL